MIIGISGKKQSGKDLTANIIQYLIFKYRYPNVSSHMLSASRPFNITMAYPSNYMVVKFADKLKDIVCLILGCTREQVEDETFKNTPLGPDWAIPFNTKHSYVYWNPRLLMQYLGTDVFRNTVCKSTWINSTMANYTPHSNWIISDVRFPGEVKAVHDKEGIVIRINRPSIISTDQHESETALDNYDNFDYVIENIGDIPELIEKVRDILTLEGIIN